MNPIQPLLVARSLMIDASKRRCLIFCPKPPADAVVSGATIAFHDSFVAPSRYGVAGWH
ncbi:hypothetical protein RESH_00559 [Rhodopirellula europaea SH398]|uniref:Uncharacterized protein n=1 Tax=Rhodopirellula europaea SH398 TaxID=1263868 RepID=M5SBN6_9BACT|nr:hypothetical protein RESH_00559 [Rhodopirellula europaea SH398]